MKRRALIGAALALLAAVRRGFAQPAARKVKVAVLGLARDPFVMRTQYDPFRETLRALGWLEGQNLAIEFRFTEGRNERLPALIDELIGLEPDVLVVLGPRAALRAKEVTKMLPIVAIGVDDPVQTGLVPSIARPGGNITGIAAAFTGMVEKRLQLLKDIVPTARRFAIVFNPASVPTLAGVLPKWQAGLGVALSAVEVHGPQDFDAAFAAMAKDGVNGIVLFADPMIWIERARLGELVRKHRLPSVWGGGAYLEDGGGIASYQGDFSAMFRRGAALVDKILKGTKPGDIPFEQMTKLELVVNLKGAKALGITIPQSVLLQADEVIE